VSTESVPSPPDVFTKPFEVRLASLVIEAFVAERLVEKKFVVVACVPVALPKEKSEKNGEEVAPRRAGVAPVVVQYGQ
jgi:hypothetical protein